ncbi:MAG: hypothetical protein AAGJ37_01330 [Pseudomonadota bacterium]
MNLDNPTKKNRLSFILMIFIFIIPVVLAKLALDNNWFNKGATNRGILLDPIIEAQSLLGDAQNKWHFVYVLPSECLSECENAIYSIQQLHTAVGREKNRVNALFLATEKSATSLVGQLDGKTGIEVLQTSQESVNNLFKDVDLNAIFIADTLHNVVLYYPNTNDREQAIMDSRDMLADLRKLLKLSRIG